MYRAESSNAVALHGLCPHRFAPLHRGVVIGESIRCPYHGLRFDQSGQCVHMPLGDPAPPRACVRCYPLVERYGLLFIWMGDVEKADPTIIPDLSALEAPDAAWFRFTLHANANYQLLVDNLLDLTHPEFLHPMLALPGYAAKTKYTVRQEGTAIHVNGIAENIEASPINKMMNPELGDVGTNQQLETWYAPSIIRLDVTFSTDSGAFVSSSGHFLTPETEDTTHYFVVGDQAKDPFNEELTQTMCQAIKNTFANEDLPIVEAQQKVIGASDLLDLKPAILRSDQGAILARRYLAKAIREEQAALEHAAG